MTSDIRTSICSGRNTVCGDLPATTLLATKVMIKIKKKLPLIRYSGSTVATICHSHGIGPATSNRTSIAAVTRTTAISRRSSRRRRRISRA